MPKRYPLQTTFEAGSLSPLMYSRSDLPEYHKSVRNMVNMFADTRGAAISRPGMEFKQNVADPSDRFGRLFTFRVSPSRAFVLAITPTSIWITDKTGLVESDNLVSNGSFGSGATDWIFSSGPNGYVQFLTGLARLASGKTDELVDSFAQIDQEITTISPTNDHIIRVDSRSVTLGGNTISVLVGTAQGLGDIAQRTSSSDNIQIKFTPNVTTMWVRVKVVGRFTQIGIPGGGEPPPGGGEPNPEFEEFFSSVIKDVDQVSVVDLSLGLTGAVEFTSPYTEEQIHDIQIEMAPDLQRMYFVHREVPVHQLDYDVTFNTWDFIPTVFNWTPGPDPWTNVYPGAITFFQSRLYLASTVEEPVSIWGSRPGSANYNDFSDLGGVNPDDPIKVIIARNSDIQWMQGSKVLYVGCDNSEHIITSDGPAVVNLDIEVQQQSAYGSARIKTDWVSSNIAFTSWDQRRVRLINFDSNTKNISSVDLTFMSEHLTQGLVTEMHHFSHPVNILWFPLANGNLVSCSFEKDRGVKAWSNHTLPGSIQSITIVEEQGRSIIYILTLRNDRLRLLRMGLVGVYMDEYVNRGYPNPTNIVLDLGHLEGDTVQVIGDGNLYPNAIVTGGQITTIGPPASEFQVGLAMSRFLETIPVDDIISGQSSAPHAKSWNRIYVRVLASILPEINGVRPPDRTPSTPMDTREPNRSQIIKVHNTGWDNEGTITVSQGLPFDLVITGIFGELTEENI